MPSSSPSKTRGSRAPLLLLSALVLGAVAAKGYEIYVEPRGAEQRHLGILPMGGPAPAFELQRKDGSVVRLSDLRGKTVLLNFWATWCDSCRAEMPSMEQLATELTGEPFVMLAASVDDGFAPIDGFFAGSATRFQVALDPGARWAAKYGTSKYPETYLIGPDGNLKAKFVGPRDWSEESFVLYLRRAMGASAGRGGPGSPSATAAR